MIRLLRYSIAAVITAFVFNVQAEKLDALFINLTSDVKEHRTEMALVFASKALKRGHDVTVFLNDKAVTGAVATNPDGVEARDQMAILMSKGATVIACGHCMTHYGIDPTSLLKGIKSGDAELVFGKLFTTDSRTLTW
jgi:sulfur relay (sulfurtransferase) complex TusBCD TusD component (DsrE family)